MWQVHLCLVFILGPFWSQACQNATDATAWERSLNAPDEVADYFFRLHDDFPLVLNLATVEDHAFNCLLLRVITARKAFLQRHQFCNRDLHLLLVEVLSYDRPKVLGQ